MYPICHSEKRSLVETGMRVYIYIYIQFIPQPGSTGWAWLDVLRALCATKGLDVERESTTHFPPRPCVTVPKDSLFPTRLRNFQLRDPKSLITRVRTTFRFVRFKGRIFKRVIERTLKLCPAFLSLWRVTEILQPFTQNKKRFSVNGALPVFQPSTAREVKSFYEEIYEICIG